MVTRINPRELSRAELVEAVIEHISRNGRALYTARTRAFCSYRAPDGNRCAVGVCLPEPLARRLVSKGVGDISDFFTWDSDKLELHLEVKNELALDIHPLEFWDSLQGLHDGKAFWEDDANGRLKLSALGRKYYEELLGG